MTNIGTKQVTVVCTLLLLASISIPLGAQERPITYPDLLTALSARLPPGMTKQGLIANLIADVRRRKVDKPLTSDIESLLRQAGAPEPLIDEIRRNAPRPLVSFLTVTSNLPDATIEIERHGSYRSAVHRLQVNTGTYRVYVHRPGYVPETHSVSIARLGEERTVQIILKALPLDAMLSEAEEKLNLGDYKGALARAGQVLEFAAANSRATNIVGRSRYYIDGSGTDEMLEAVRQGEKIRLLVRRYNKEGRSHQLIEGELTIDRNYLEFISNVKPEMTFTLFKPDVSEIRSALDESRVQYLHLKGRGTFAARRREQAVRIYPHSVLVRSGGQAIFCSACGAGQCPCESQSTGLFLLVSGWKNKLR